MKSVVPKILSTLIFLIGSGYFFAQKYLSFPEDKAKVDLHFSDSSRYSTFENEDLALKVLALSRRIGYRSGEIQTLRKLGVTYAVNYEEDKALNVLSEAMEIAEQWGTKFDQLKVLADLTNTYRRFNYYKEALENAQLAISLAGQIGNDSYRALGLYDKALVHLSLDQKDKYFELIHLALSIYESLEDYAQMAQLNTHLGIVILKPDSSQMYFDKAKVLLPLIEDPKTRMEKSLKLYETIAATVSAWEDYEEIEKVAKKGLALARKLGKAESIAINQYYMSVAQFKRYKNFDKAIAFADSSLQYEKSISRHYHVVIYAKYIAKVYSAAKQPKKALEYAELAMLYQDSLYWANRRNDAAEVEKEYKLENQQSEIKLLENQRRTRTILGLSFASVFLLFAGFYYRQHRLKSRFLKNEEELSNQLRKDKEVIEQQKLELEVSNATKDRLFAIIGHDLRGPLFSLQGLEEQINYLLETGQQERLKELGSTMEKTTTFLTDTLNNLLNWSMNQMGQFPYHPKNVNLKSNIQNIFSLFAGNADAKNIQLNMNIPSIAAAHVDEVALNTILRNLLSNAIKFTPNGGQVDITGQSENGKVKLKISDSGIGISEEQAQQITKGTNFLRKRGTEGEKSTGLGLVLCKDLIEQNQGSMKINSKVGKGTTFEIILPSSIPASSR